MRVHFISIGGSVMHQLAIALHKKGYRVTGTDDEIFEPARGNLAAEGLLPDTIGWDTGLITKDIDAVILGMHAKSDNPELLKARELGLTIYSFPEYIYHESRNKKRIVVGGSHGKTTTTSMIMHVLKTLGRDFDYLVGARVQGFEQSVDITEAPLIVCEGDEYPASAIEKKPKFHFLYPHVAILTGIAWDHINVFPTFDFYLEQFVVFINRIEKDGLLIYNESDTVLKKLVEENRRSDIRYQPYAVPQHRIEQGQTRVTIEGVTGLLKVFGNHNLMNLFAAYYACRETGVKADEFVTAIGSFTGAAKRLELLASNAHTNVYRDFAHAPSKVKATTEALKQQYPARRLVCVLELHTYSSLNGQFMQEYRGALDKADAAAVFYSRHALELKRLPDLPAEKVREGFDKNGLAVITDAAELANWLEKQDFTDANLALMSSGNYDGLDMLTFARKITNT
ncbi:UDP-N-acetylmuramate--L-alanine ligase [Sediminibacterium soli]|uniref:UDP-N-acetylmuramate--L-alanine ligase n=1 Tax=Sediminibacterium soli TaxID=2698829 RepID=UPI00137A174B|nr:Mur ligase family protein [Sediminibacterium soli]NCI46475.1 peptidoglycan synthetase [Sediminibacterium soli]